MMRSFIFYFALLGLISIAPACAAAERPPMEPIENGVVVLRTGGVLTGRITASGDRYLIRGEKNEFDVAAGQVMLVCRSLHDAYEQQRDQSTRPTTDSHLALAEWCLRYGLMPEAAQELAAARKLDEQNPRLVLLERRFAVLQEPHPETSTDADSAELASEKQSEELRELDAIAAELPAGAVERFSRRVQPLIVNNCTTSGCHQAGSGQEFQLDRAVLHGLSNRRTTLRNLSATLALVDRNNPQVSSLLSIPQEKHGDVQPPMFGMRQEEHLVALAEWIALVTRTPKPGAPAGLATATCPPQPAPVPSARSRLEPNPLAMPTPAAQMLATRVEQSVFDGMPPVRQDAQLTPWRPKDEFDPELFNRRFGAQENGREAPPSSESPTGSM